MADLTTLANLKQRLAITGTNPEDLPDAYLEDLIDQSSTFINQNIIGREMTQVVNTEYCDGMGTDTLFLRNGPSSSVTSVSSVVWDSAGSATATALNAGDYFLRGTVAENWTRRSRIVGNGYVFVEGVQNYKVIYTSGYGQMREDIEGACLDLCVARHNRRLDMASSARTIGDGSLSLNVLLADVHDDLKRRLVGYLDVENMYSDYNRRY